MTAVDVVIVGAGVVGASFALSLKQADVSVALVEPQPRAEIRDDSSWDSRVYTISPGNAAWLRTLEVWPLLPAERVCRVETMLVYGDRGGSSLEFSAYDAGLRELAFVVENRQLQHALWQALQDSGHVRLLQGTRCVNVSWERESARLVLDDGSELNARLIVAADGADSWVRERAGIQQRVYDYRELGVVANFGTECAHQGIAYQWFRADGVLALLPLPGNRVSMVWSAPEARAAELLALPPEKLCEQVAQASRHVLGSLKLITKVAAFPLRRQRVARLVEPRAALLGDAAHNVHPLAGQGVNLGLRDARQLAEVLTGRGAQRDCGDYALLRRYERARKEDIMALDFTTDGLEKLFSAQHVSLSRLRNVGLALLDAQPSLKKVLIRRAVA
jgi:ubiquinone biosynthesis UbiH/UbiF/VisC/COQ6 family hydroxylase